MAEIQKGILGGVQGKVGTVVGVNWRGKNVIRSLPTRKKNVVASEKQLLQRAKFKLMVDFLNPLRQLTSKYFGESQGTKSRTNLAMSYQLQEAIVETANGPEIDFSKVVITKGVLTPAPVVLTKLEEEKLTISWKSDAGKGLAKATDILTVVVYNSDYKGFYVLNQMVDRTKEIITENLPSGWTKNNQVWMVWVDEKQKQSSTSVYVGEF
ncbi:MAG: DUF6266 family protein [Flavobacteriaceae bacterium]|jgi:hypothetical protein|nr:DUF6266 family protein [Flavobacteriaceae bacterium]